MKLRLAGGFATRWMGGDARKTRRDPDRVAAYAHRQRQRGDFWFPLLLIPLYVLHLLPLMTMLPRTVPDADESARRVDRVAGLWNRYHRELVAAPRGRRGVCNDRDEAGC